MPASEERQPLDGRWRVWPWGWLRSAGFPLAWLDRFGGAAEAADTWIAAPGGAEREAARESARAAYHAIEALENEALLDAARDPRFREALAWQNRRALETALAPLLRARKNDSKTRQHRRVVLGYLQRYCAKNDTIGFFGPMSWLRVGDRGPALTLEIGADLLQHRESFFEPWALSSLAETWALPLRPSLAPRIHPALVDLPREEPWATLLGWCDGEATGEQIASRAAQDPRLDIDSIDEGLALLEELAERRLIRWTLELPVLLPRAEPALRDLLAQRPQAEAALAELDALIELRAALSAAAGSAERIAVGSSSLEARFTAITSREASRGAGETYAARAIVYEDTLRGVAATLGPGVLDSIRGPLGGILDSARWLGWQVARAFEPRLGSVLEALAAGALEVPLPRLLEAFAAELADPPRLPEARAAARELREGWQAILRPDPSAARQEHRWDDLAAAVAARFAAPGAGWPRARWHSPDLMVAAPDPAAICRGEATIVLGEIHAATNTLFAAFAVALHPDPERLFALAEADLPEPSLDLLPSRSGITRAHLIPARPSQLHAELGAEVSPLPRAQVFRAGDLRYRRGPHGWRVVSRSRPADLDLPAIASLEWLLSPAVASSFGVLLPQPHHPRITIDRLVVARETWRFEAPELSFARAKLPFDRFVEARRWARTHRLPRWVFVRTPGEAKPFFADLTSPGSVELLAHRLRPAPWASVSEMLPGPADCWLTDREGNRYTSELRLVLVEDQAIGSTATSRSSEV